MKMRPLLELNVGGNIGQFRACPVQLGGKDGKAILAIYSSEFDVDPFYEMFYFPSDTYKMILFRLDGTVIWRKDLGKAVVPGMWFCPVYPFDLDGDGCDEIYFVNNMDPKHPLGLSNYVLERLDAHTGASTGQWKWPNYGGVRQSLSHTFRNFIFGGNVRGEPVLITAQGTYRSMYLQAWGPDMEMRWKTEISEDTPGARGSHKCPVVDINHDGVDEVMWGERCIELDRGTELFCCDRDSYRGHSDMNMPMFDRERGEWLIYTARESDRDASPRVVCFDSEGRRVWGAVDQGHMDLNWVARIGEGGRHVAMSIKIDKKTCGPDGRFHFGREEFVFDAYNGQSMKLPFSVYGTHPVDVNGDGLHEFVCDDGTVKDKDGKVLATIGGLPAMFCHWADHPGEHVLTYEPDGTVRLWADTDAADSPEALARYEHPYYRMNRRASCSGANRDVLSGI